MVPSGGSMTITRTPDVSLCRRPCRAAQGRPMDTGIWPESTPRCGSRGCTRTHPPSRRRRRNATCGFIARDLEIATNTPFSAPRTCSFGDVSEERSRVDGLPLQGRYRGCGLRAHSTVWPPGVAVAPTAEAGISAAARITTSHHTDYVTSSRSVPTMIRIMASASSNTVDMTRYTC